jgi:hypothetical protein
VVYIYRPQAHQTLTKLTGPERSSGTIASVGEPLGSGSGLEELRAARVREGNGEVPTELPPGEHRSGPAPAYEV